MRLEINLGSLKKLHREFILRDTINRSNCARSDLKIGVERIISAKESVLPSITLETCTVSQVKELQQ
jgi:hypothetical protein